MATVKEIKKELDEKNIVYPPKANKPYLEELLSQEMILVTENGAEVVEFEERPNHIAGKRPDYIDQDADFIDPNADPGSQAD